MNDVTGLQQFLRSPLKQRLAANQLALCFTARMARTVDIARIAKASGYDALYLDLEHTTMSHEIASQLCSMALEVGLTPVVRVPSADPHHVAMALDGGAMGIIVPHVQSAEAARQAVRSVKYPPFGSRSIATLIPQLRGERWPAREAQALINAETAVIAMIESQEGLENAEAIASVEGVDVLFIGTNDLCADLGIHGQFDHELVDKAYRKVVHVSRANGKHAGIGGLATRPDLVAKFVDMGARFVSVGSDVSFMSAAARDTANQLRALPL